MAGTGRSPHWPMLGLLIVAILAYPLVLASNYAVGAGINVGVMAVATVGFILLIGYARQLAVGQAAFCMIGGYGNGLLTTRYGTDPAVALLVSALAAMAIAYVVGKPILRLRGYALAMASLCLQLILEYAANQAESITGGAAGIAGIPKFALFGWRLASDRAFFYLIWACVVLSLLIGITIDRSPIGRTLKAIASSERAASAMGIDIARQTLQMFVLSAGLASVSGSLAVHYLRIMGADVFGFQYSLNIITAVVAGGLNAIWGGVVGAAAVIGLREALRLTELPQLEGVIMGALTVGVLLIFPRGIVGGLALLFASSRATATRPAPEPAGAADLPAINASPPTGRPILTVAGVSRSFGNLRAVDAVDFTVAPASITALIGPNGAGKTTLFDLICGFQPLDAGEITFLGERVERLEPFQVARRGMGRSFQNLEMFANLSVLENVMCGAHRHARAGLAAVLAHWPTVAAEEGAARDRAARCLAFVGIAGLADRLPGTLSFGQQRLVEIARALALGPSLLLMDEPASGLNDSETEQLAYLILRIRAAGITVLLIEHDLRLVMGLADHLVVMNHGQKIAEGPPQEVRSDPGVVAAYIGAAA